MKKKISQKDHRLGRYIQKIRQSKNITQEKLAEKIGTSQTWIAYIETGRNRPNLKMLEKIAKVSRCKSKRLNSFLTAYFNPLLLSQDFLLCDAT